MGENSKKLIEKRTEVMKVGLGTFLTNTNETCKEKFKKLNLIDILKKKVNMLIILIKFVCLD